MAKRSFVYHHQGALGEPMPEGTVAEAHELVTKATEAHRPAATFLLFSGGSDSLVLLDTCAHLADAVVHVNTGIGIPETTDFVRRVAASAGKPYIELTPPIPYDELVLTRWNGMPGPGAHGYTYDRLKGRPFEELLRRHRTKRGQRFILLTGLRRAESRRRALRQPVDRKGGEVWTNPLLYWSNRQMAAYRAEHDLPVNPVSANLHMSGECLCGAMADQGPGREERAMIRFFYPSFDRRLCELEAACRSAGLASSEWGVRRDDLPAGTGEVGPLCVGCAVRSAAGS